MLCENCKKNVANTHIRVRVNGVERDLQLCSECAQKEYPQIFNPAFTPMDHILDSFFKDELKGFLKSGDERARCPGCGFTFEDIAQSGRVGCAECYHTFEQLLAPSIKRIHGNTRHVGKVPSSAGEGIKKRQKIEELKKELNERIRNQDFEEAAKLRDAIKELESEGKGHDADK